MAIYDFFYSLFCDRHFSLTPIYKDYHTPSADCASWIPGSMPSIPKASENAFIAFWRSPAYGVYSIFSGTTATATVRSEHDVKITKERQADIQGRFYVSCESVAISYLFK